MTDPVLSGCDRKNKDPFVNKHPYLIHTELRIRSFFL